MLLFLIFQKKKESRFWSTRKLEKKEVYYYIYIYIFASSFCEGRPLYNLFLSLRRCACFSSFFFRTRKKRNYLQYFSRCIFLSKYPILPPSFIYSYYVLANLVLSRFKVIRPNRKITLSDSRASRPKERQSYFSFPLLSQVELNEPVGVFFFSSSSSCCLKKIFNVQKYSCR